MHDPFPPLRPRRTISGLSAVLLPFADGAIDWAGFRNLLTLTVDAGLVPAVNMDTGYVNLLSPDERLAVLDATRSTLGDGLPFVAGAFVADREGDAWHRDATLRAFDAITSRGGTPVLFPSFGLNGQSEEAIVRAHEEVGRHCDRFIAFELGPQFAPFGRVHSIEAYREILAIRSCVGAKHSSLSRPLEWERLALRDRERPEFRVYTGNDLAIDMAMYGSDYLLGLSACAPDLFAERDRRWADGDLGGFLALNDPLQYLGHFAFRPPVPAYKHSVAMFLKLRGRIASDEPHPKASRRPDPDREVLRPIAETLGVLAREG